MSSLAIETPGKWSAGNRRTAAGEKRGRISREHHPWSVICNLPLGRRLRREMSSRVPERGPKQFTAAEHPS
jgi:hypothetical protein